MENILQKLGTLYDKRHETWLHFSDFYDEFTQIYDESYSGLTEEFNKYDRISEDKTKKRAKIMKKINQKKDIDDFICDIWSDTIDQMNIYCEYDDLFTIDNKYCSTAHITRSKGINIADNCCSLCLENHDIKHLIRTSCGHYYGKSCFAEFVKHCFYEDEEKFKCPNCRCEEFSIQQFKYKK